MSKTKEKEYGENGNKVKKSLNINNYFHDDVFKFWIYHKSNSYIR